MTTWRCLYCTFEADGPEVPVFIRDGRYCGPGDYVGPAEGLYAHLVDFLARTQRAISLAGPTLDVGGSFGPYRMFYPAPYSVLDDWTNDEEWVRDGLIQRPDASYGTVASTETLEHIDDPVRYVGEMARITQPGGHIIVTTPMTWGYHPSPRDYWRMQPDAIWYLATRHGLTLESAEWVFIQPDAVAQFVIWSKPCAS